jgi:hypothetical protein
MDLNDNEKVEKQFMHEEIDLNSIVLMLPTFEYDQGTS